MAADDPSERKRVEDEVAHCYSTWGETYFDEYYGENAPYPPVQVDLVRRLIVESGAKTVLDAGCGPVSYLRTLFGEELDLYGFDLTPDMVAEGKRVMAAANLDPERIWLGSVLEADSFRHASSARDRYDAVVSLGVAPHIRAADDALFMERLAGATAPGGVAIVEARNALFALFTANRPTYEFLAQELIDIDGLRARAGDDAPALDGAMESLKGHFRMDLPPIRGGKADEPGYDHVVSRTHNPLLLSQTMEAAGFCNVTTHFYHFHALPPMFSGAAPELFMRESVAMENDRDWRGYFMASAFILRGERP